MTTPIFGHELVTWCHVMFQKNSHDCWGCSEAWWDFWLCIEIILRSSRQANSPLQITEIVKLLCRYWHQDKVMEWSHLCFIVFLQYLWCLMLYRCVMRFLMTNSDILPNWGLYVAHFSWRLIYLIRQQTTDKFFSWHNLSYINQWFE